MTEKGLTAQLSNSEQNSEKPALEHVRSGSQGLVSQKTVTISKAKRNKAIEKLPTNEKRYRHDVVYISDIEATKAAKAAAEAGDEADEKKEAESLLTEIAPADRKDDDKAYADPNGRRVVFFDGKFKRVSEITTADETFRAIFHVYFTWLATEEDNKSYKNWVDKDKRMEAERKAGEHEDTHDAWKPEWIPLEKIEFVNQVGGDPPAFGEAFGYKVKSGMKYKPPKGMSDFSCDKTVPGSSFDISLEDLGFNPRLGTWIRMKWECDMIFAEEFELNLFPVDIQTLSIHIQGTEDCKKMELLPFPRMGDFFTFDPRFSLISEWHISRLLLEFGHSDPLKSKSLKSYPTIAIHTKARRRWLATFSPFIITFGMAMLGLATFSMDAKEEVADRLAYAITLLLADVATLQLVEEQIPKIAYWTILDFYTYSVFGDLVAQTIWVALCGRIDYFTNSTDDKMFWFFFVLFFVIHIGMFTAVMKLRKVEESKLDMGTAELEEFFDEQQRQCGFCSLCSATQDKPCLSTDWDWKTLRDEDGKNAGKRTLLLRANRVLIEE